MVSSELWSPPSIPLLARISPPPYISFSDYVKKGLDEDKR